MDDADKGEALPDLDRRRDFGLHALPTYTLDRMSTLASADVGGEEHNFQRPAWAGASMLLRHGQTSRIWRRRRKAFESVREGCISAIIFGMRPSICKGSV